jgi:hypothetical protein
MGKMVTMKEIAMKEIAEEMGEMVTTPETTVAKKIDGSENSGYDMLAEPAKLIDDERRKYLRLSRDLAYYLHLHRLYLLLFLHTHFKLLIFDNPF